MRAEEEIMDRYTRKVNDAKKYHILCAELYDSPKKDDQTMYRLFNDIAESSEYEAFALAWVLGIPTHDAEVALFGKEAVEEADKEMPSSVDD